MINDLLSPTTAATSPFAQNQTKITEESLRALAVEIVRLTPNLAETLVRTGLDKPTLHQPAHTVDHGATGR